MQMHRGARGEAGASIKMIPSYVTALPSGNETGSFWAIDMGGSNLRVLETILLGGGNMRLTINISVLCNSFFTSCLILTTLVPYVFFLIVMLFR